MRKIIFILILVLISSPACAGQFTINYPNDAQGRIVEGLTQDGSLCLEEEAIGACAKRQVVVLMKDAIRQYEVTKAKANAAQGVLDADIS